MSKIFIDGEAYKIHSYSSSDGPLAAEKEFITLKKLLKEPEKSPFDAWREQHHMVSDMPHSRTAGEAVNWLVDELEKFRNNSSQKGACILEDFLNEAKRLIGRK